MRAFHFCLALAIVATSIPHVAVSATRIITPHPERAKLSPATRRDLVLADLRAILTGPASPDRIATAPYASYWGDMCRRDVIAISYTISASDRRLDKPLGVRTVSPQYYYFGGQEGRGTVDRDKTCTRLSGDEAGWVEGDDRQNKTHEAFVMLQTAASVLRGESRDKVDCVHPEIDQPDFNCGAEFLAAIANLSSLGGCYEQGDCYNYWFDRYEATITRTCGTGCTLTIEMREREIITT